MCVCVYVHTCMHLCVCTVCTNSSMHAYACICAPPPPLSLLACIVYTCVHVHVHVCVCAQIHAYMQECKCVFGVYFSVCVCVYVCVHACTCMHARMWACTHTYMSMPVTCVRRKAIHMSMHVCMPAFPQHTQLYHQLHTLSSEPRLDCGLVSSAGAASCWCASSAAVSSSAW